MNILYLIPARGGSKGIPGKNIKPLNGKPLIYYTLDVAKALAKEGDIICISTDDELIVKVVEDYKIKVPFKRPANLATDNAGAYEVILHALQFYEHQGKQIDRIVLLQPTSPFRRAQHVTEALSVFSDDLDMVVSVKETKSNPYYVLTEENEDGFLAKSKKGNFGSRQNCPQVYEYNGAVYVINPNSLKKKHMSQFTRIKKYLMDQNSSVDLDTPLDWAFAEYLIKETKYYC